MAQLATPPKITVRFDHPHRPPPSLPYQPLHPSSLHTSILPSPPSSRRSSPSATHPPATTDSSDALPGDRRPPLPRTHSSQRRVWSETLPRTGESMLASGKRPSTVMGGFETTSEEDYLADGVPTSSSGTGMTTPGDDRLSSRDVSYSDSAWKHEPAKRSRSLVLPSSDKTTGSAGMQVAKTAPKRWSDHKPKRKPSKDTPARPPSRASRGGGRSPSLGSHLSARSDGGHGFPNGLTARGRTASSRSQYDPAARPNRQDSMSSPDSRPVDGNRHGGERTSSPEGISKDKGKGKETAQEKDKDVDDRQAKQRESTANTLVESLGLGGLNIKNISLNTDQIHSLLSDSDLASAIRMVNGTNPISPRISAIDPYNHATPSASATTDPPNHVSPYLVSAPPPLTKDSPNSRSYGRERAVSTVSSIGSVTATPSTTTWSPRFRSTSDAVPPYDGHGLGNPRPRSASRASMSTDMHGGHIPFTHHLPMVPQEADEEEDNNYDEVSSQTHSGTVEGVQPVREQSLLWEDSKAKETKKEKKKGKGKSALSNLFHFGRQRGSNGNGNGNGTEGEHTPKVKEKEHHWRAADWHSEEHARDREAREREEEMRRIEWEKRQEEIMQERRYRALTQVAAHPHAERLAYRTGAHLRAYYQHVYDCLENPPRLNFTKMLRWLTETDRQNALRAQYYASHHEHDVNHHTHERSNGSSSRVNLGSSQRSVGSGRTRSVSSQRQSLRDDVSSPQKQVPDLVIPRRGWKYTVEDIQAFRDSGGVVNYFVPPRQIHPYNDEVNEEEEEEAEEERSASPQTVANRVEHDLNRNYFGRRTATPQSQSRERERDLFDHSRDDNSSAAGSSKKGHPHDFSLRTPNNTASNVSLVDMDQGMRETNLSRSTSFDTGGDKPASGKGDHRVSHRTHQSLGGVGHSSLSHALKQPFGKLSSVTKKQRTMPHFHPYGVDRDRERERENGQTNDFAASSDRTGGVALSGSFPSTQRSGLVSRDSLGSVTNKSNVNQTRNNVNRLKEPSFFKRHGLAGHESMTTDEEGSRLKLFIKGTRKIGLDDHKKRLDKNVAECRDEELKEAERIYAREQQFKNNQVQEEEEKAKVTKEEEAALKRILDLEKDIYHERAQRLATVKDRLAVVNSNIHVIDESIRQYLTQIDFARDEAKIGMGLEADWSLVEPLRSKYTRRRRSIDLADDANGELRDTVPPLRSFDSGDSESDGHHRPQSAPIVRRARSRSNSRSGPGQMPKRTLSLHNSIALHHIDPLQARHHPRRTYLAPDGLTRVDPVKHVELMIAFGKKQEKEVGKEKDDMAKQMEKMIGQIEAMIRQKEEVRHWVADVLERVGSFYAEIRILKDNADIETARLKRQRHSLKGFGSRKIHSWTLSTLLDSVTNWSTVLQKLWASPYGWPGTFFSGSSSRARLSKYFSTRYGLSLLSSSRSYACRGWL
ncbi:hypothetical protein D1P53_001213 [Cryptococcus gattii VGV]|nr:hypothetical protein D1P53_001213 [Cryptococcus gattii VGV]